MCRSRPVSASTSSSSRRGDEEATASGHGDAIRATASRAPGINGTSSR